VAAADDHLAARGAALQHQLLRAADSTAEPPQLPFRVQGVRCTPASSALQQQRTTPCPVGKPPPASLTVCVCVLKRNSARAPVPTTARTQPQMGGGVDPVSAREQAESARTCTPSATAERQDTCITRTTQAEARYATIYRHSDLPQDTNNMTDTRTSANAMTGERQP
jgi:hypothetical protein